MLNNEKGAVLILSYLVVTVLLTLSLGVVYQGILEKRSFDVTKQRADAFYMAEAGMDAALVSLRTNQNYGGTGASNPVNAYRGLQQIGQYANTVVDIGGGGFLRRVTAYGYVPQMTPSPGVLQQTCQVEGVVYVPIIPPGNFFDNAIYAVDGVDFHGGTYSVTGDIECGDDVTNTGHSSGTVNGDIAEFDAHVTQDSFYCLNFQSLQALAQQQTYSYEGHTVNNNFTTQDLENRRPLPTSFWYREPTDPEDPTTGVPNIVYIEGPLIVRANNFEVGGFILVVGDLTSPGVTTSDEDATINGNVTVNGCLYTTGDFTLNGHGNSVIDGGLWTGGEAYLQGNTAFTYNPDYMLAIKHYVENNTPPTLSLLSWRQLQLNN
jgi:hypothetical protein